MKLTFKKFLESDKYAKNGETKAITQDEYNEMSDAEKGTIFSSYLEAVQKEFEASLDGKLDKDSIAEEVKTVFDAQFKDLFTPEQIDKKLKEIDEAVKEWKDNKEGEPTKQEPLSVQIKKRKSEILEAIKTPGKEVVLKTLVTRSSVSNSISGHILPDIGQLGVKERSLYNVLPKITISDRNTAGVIRYRDWVEASITRAAAPVAEGAAFPESVAAWDWYSLNIRKIGDQIPVTEEFFEDEAQAAAELEMFLDTNVRTKIDSQIATGDNTGQNLKGLVTSAPAYTAAASSISDANLKDLVIKMRNSITRTRGSKYRPDIVVLASSTMEDLVLSKNSHNNYIFDENLGTIAGMSVIIDENMADNQVVVGDRRFARIYEMPGIVISRGFIGDQFKEDEMTIKARKRLALLVRKVDETGFLKVTDVDAALTTLAT